MQNAWLFYLSLMLAYAISSSEINTALSSTPEIILPQCSQVLIFFFVLISDCVCGGINPKQPPQAFLLTFTTAKPFL